MDLIFKSMHAGFTSVMYDGSMLRDSTLLHTFAVALPDAIGVSARDVVLPVVPTAENLAAEAFRILDAAYRDTYGNQLRLQRVRLYETPNNWADAER